MFLHHVALTEATCWHSAAGRVAGPRVPGQLPLHVWAPLEGWVQQDRLWGSCPWSLQHSRLRGVRPLHSSSGFPEAVQEDRGCFQLHLGSLAASITSYWQPVCLSKPAQTQRKKRNCKVCKHHHSAQQLHLTGGYPTGQGRSTGGAGWNSLCRD